MSKTVHDWIRQHLLHPDLPFADAVALADDKIERSNDLDKLAYNRLILGAMRYEALGGVGLAQVQAAIERLQSYLQDGNREHLVDVSNMIRIEWVRPSHPAPCWITSDDGVHVSGI